MSCAKRAAPNGYSHSQGERQSRSPGKPRPGGFARQNAHLLRRAPRHRSATAERGAGGAETLRRRFVRSGGAAHESASLRRFLGAAATPTPRKAGMRPRSGMQAPQLQSADARHPLRCPIPLRGSLGQRCGAPLRPASRASHLSIFRANAAHGGLIQRFLSFAGGVADSPARLTDSLGGRNGGGKQRALRRGICGVFCAKQRVGGGSGIRANGERFD